ncbi:hypothetical protein [Pseudomonas syringae]|uniref:hypothetical protein n=1 Tax=Pseudomonas syringae TaxID=317 RepID=UPI00036BA3E5|nr:hypothetical protein [Pseudomonas syringae]
MPNNQTVARVSVGLTGHQVADLLRFHETTEDGQDYDVAKAGMKELARTLTLFAHGAQFKADGFGHVGFSGGVTAGLTRCYIAWKLGVEFEAVATG